MTLEIWTLDTWFFLRYHILFNSFSNYFLPIWCLKCSPTQSLPSWPEFIIVSPSEATWSRRKASRFLQEPVRNVSALPWKQPQEPGSLSRQTLHPCSRCTLVSPSSAALRAAPPRFSSGAQAESVSPSRLGRFHGRGQKYSPVQSVHTEGANVMAVHIPLSKACPKAKAEVSEVGICVESSWILRQTNDSRRPLVTGEREQSRARIWSTEITVARTKYDSGKSLALFGL